MTELDRTMSRQLAKQASELLAGGVNSNVRLPISSYFFARGQGARIWDVDGNEYVDYVLGQGPMMLGHSDPTITHAVADACASGMVFGAQNPLEIDAALSILAATSWPERVRLCMTGSEAVQAALRVARAATGRQKVVRFSGHYHGWIDNMLIDQVSPVPRPGSLGQSQSTLDDVILLAWDDIGALEVEMAHHSGEVAALIMEPVMFNAGARLPSENYLQQVREVCTRCGVVLVFDEVITGFRLGLGGAAEYFGVTPDLAVYGKALAGGWPVAALVGRAGLMDLIGKGVNHSGTFNGSVMACAATIAALDQLRQDPPYERMRQYGSALIEGLKAAGDAVGVSVFVEGVPMAFWLAPVAATQDGAHRDADQSLRFASLLAEFGIWTTTRGIWFVSAKHADAELEWTLARFAKALAAGVKSSEFDWQRQ
jgi:glutamate-1-semialdehyde 2,1-aminomutase